MSIRNTFLKDYGISKELGDKIVSYCRNAHDYDQNLISNVGGPYRLIPHFEIGGR